MTFGRRMISLRRRLGRIFVLALAIAAGAEEAPPAADAESRATLVDSVTATLNERYVFEDVAKDMEKHVRKKLRKGEYDELTTIPDFARTLTEDLREISGDRHLGVRYASDEEIQAFLQGDEDPDLDHERELAEQRRDNFQFKKLEILPGNVGYLKLNAFVDASLSGPTATAALNFLAHTEALIIDLRENGGGSPSLNCGMSVPYARAVNPLSGTNWEGTGIEPHIAVPQEQAFDRAYLEALTELRESEDDEDRAFALEWAIEGLQAKLNPVELDGTTLQEYAGQYGPRKLWVEDGVLQYQREDGPIRQGVPMGETLFRFEGLDYFRLEIVLDGAGAPIKLVGHYDNGRTDESPRSSD